MHEYLLITAWLCCDIQYFVGSIGITERGNLEYGPSPITMDARRSTSLLQVAFHTMQRLVSCRGTPDHDIMPSQRFGNRLKATLGASPKA